MVGLLYCAKTSLQLGQLEMLNIPGNAQMKMIEGHNTTKAIAMQENSNTHLRTSHICAPPVCDETQNLNETESETFF